MTEVLAAIGLITLYFMWVISPIVTFVCIENGSDIIGKLACTAYVGGAIVIFYVLAKFIDIL